MIYDEPSGRSADQTKVDLVRLSIKQDDALTILLTGRSETNFAEVIRKIVTSKQLLFDMICLKPQAGPNSQRFSTTMKYKQAILADLIHTYKDASEIRVYEDRPKQYVFVLLIMMLGLQAIAPKGSEITFKTSTIP